MEVTVLVQDFLQQSAKRAPNKVALICGDKHLTYAEIEARANRLANSMLDHGVLRGDRVVIYMNNSVEVVVSIFATLKAGGVFVVVNPSTTREKLTYILNNCSASALIAELSNFSLVSAIMEESCTLKFNILSDSHTSKVKIDPYSIYGHTLMLDLNDIFWTYSDQRPPSINIDLDLACLIYPSNNANEPLGLMSDHNNILFTTGSIIEYLENNENDIVLNSLPLSSEYGLYQLLTVFKFGGTLVLERSFSNLDIILKRIEREQVTGLPGVPALFTKLLEMDLDSYDLSSLRYLTNSGITLPVDHIMRIQELFSWASLYIVYGLAETKRMFYLPPDQISVRPDSMGIPIPGAEAWIEDENGNHLGPEETGELVVRGRHVIRGYWKDPETTSVHYRPGIYPGERVCYTGEPFRMDKDGYFYNVKNRKGVDPNQAEKISSEEVDDFISEHDDVVEDRGVTPNQITSVDPLSPNIHPGTEGS
jgi:acyl-CoA synthetase (AMP-forming)/AMP-acid ligase II